MYIDLVTINLCPGQGGGGVKPSGTLEISENGVYDVYSYASASVDVPQSVTGYTEKDVTERSYEIINLDNSASFVASFAFEYNKTIQTVNLPYATSVGNAAFQYCSSLLQISLPMCSYIGSSVFEGCTSLSQVSLPMCISIGIAEFRYCSSLSQVNLPMVKTIGVSTFGACSALSSLTLCTDVYWTIPFGTRTYGGTPIVNASSSASIYVRSDTYSLWISSNLWSSISSKFVSVPVSGPALSFSNGLLSGTTKAIASDFTSYLSVTTSDITGVSLPECKYLYDGAFQSCTSLTQVNLPECSYIGSQVFWNCVYLSSITIGYSGVCSLSYEVFDFTPIASGTGSIYVPTSLVEAYKSAPNWSQFSYQIFPIE